jgi:4-amino-4-deoxy-L-arabinose transferase-like glycosyltransferase
MESSEICVSGVTDAPIPARRRTGRAWLRLLAANDAPALATCVFLLWLTVESHGFYMRPVPVFAGSDEGYIAAFAHRLLDGRMLPYVDAISHRGPLLYWLAAAFVAWFGKGWLPMRILALVTHLLTVVLTLACGMRAGRALSGALGALAFTLCTAVLLHWGDGHAFNGEYPMNVFVMAGMLCVTWALATDVSVRTCVWLVALGALLTSAGALCKQVGALHHLPLFLWTAAAAASRREWPRALRIRLVAAYVLAALAPIALVVGIYAVAGEYRALRYWSVLYNTRVYIGAFTPEMRWGVRQRWLLDNLLVFSLLIPFASAQLVRLARGVRSVAELPRRYDRDGFVLTVTLQAIVAVIGVQAGLRFWGHYYAQLAPWLGLALGAVLEPMPRPPRRALLQFAVLAPLMGVLGYAWAVRTLTTPPTISGEPPVCKAVQARVRPSEPLFVWGWGADWYVSCDRKPASRYVFTGVAVGYLANLPVAATPEEELARSPRRAREQLLADLSATRPPLILNSVFAGMRRIQEYPEFTPLLNQHYCPLQHLEGVEAFVRKGPGGRCGPP